MSSIISYLTELTIDDEWGRNVINIFLEAIGWRDITSIREKFIAVRNKLQNDAMQYYYFVSKRYYEATEDIKNEVKISQVNTGTIIVRMNSSWNTIRDIIDQGVKDYKNAILAYRERLPFRYLIEHRKGEIWTLDQIYLNAEKLFYGGSLKDYAAERILSTDITKGILMDLYDLYSFSVRMNALIAEMKQLTTKENRMYGDMNQMYAPNEEMLIEIKKAVDTTWYDQGKPVPEGTGIPPPIFTDIYKNQKIYEDKIDLENAPYEGRVSIGVPLKWALTENREDIVLPERPYRPTFEEMWAESKAKYPKLEPRPFSALELSRFHWIEVCNFWKDHYDNFMNNPPSFADLNSPEFNYGKAVDLNTFWTNYNYNWAGDNVNNNKFALFKLRDKSAKEIKDSIYPYPDFKASTQMLDDRMKAAFAYVKKNPTINEMYEALQLIEWYNLKYDLPNKSKRDVHRRIVLDFYLKRQRSLTMYDSFGEHPPLEISIDTYNTILSKFSSIYNEPVFWNDAILLPYFEDNPRFMQHANPTWLLQEKEFEDWYVPFLVAAQSQNEIMAILQIAAEDITPGKVYKEREDWDWYVSSHYHSVNYDKWRISKEAAVISVRRFNPAVRAYEAKWGVRPDLGDTFFYVERDWGVTYPFDYLGS